MKNPQNEYIKFILIIIPSIIAIVFVIMFIKTNNELDQVKNQNGNKIEKLNEKKKDFKAMSRGKKKLLQMERNNIALNNFHINMMREKGLTDPVQDIITDLQKHRDLIPYKGISGGKMGFYNKNEIWVLTNKWVLAFFDDGHIGGYLLLKYVVHNNGTISWQKIASMRS